MYDASNALSLRRFHAQISMPPVRARNEPRSPIVEHADRARLRQFEARSPPDGWRTTSRRAPSSDMSGAARRWRGTPPRSDAALDPASPSSSLEKGKRTASPTSLPTATIGVGHSANSCRAAATSASTDGSALPAPRDKSPRRRPEPSPWRRSAGATHRARASRASPVAAPASTTMALPSCCASSMLRMSVALSAVSISRSHAGVVDGGAIGRFRRQHSPPAPARRRAAQAPSSMPTVKKKPAPSGKVG